MLTHEVGKLPAVCREISRTPEISIKSRQFLREHALVNFRETGYLMRIVSLGFSSDMCLLLYVKLALGISKKPAAGISLSRWSQIAYAVSMGIRLRSSSVCIGGFLSGLRMPSFQGSALSVHVRCRALPPGCQNADCFLCGFH